MTGAARRIVLEVLGWSLLLLGVAAMVLPGPGLLGVFAGLAVLSQVYEWADVLVEPVKLRARLAAAEGVTSWVRIAASLLGVVLLVACGVLWVLSPASPPWWPLPESFWLPGGVWTGATQIASAVLALALIIYSYRQFRARPGACAELREEIKVADEAARERRKRGRDKVGDPS